MIQPRQWVSGLLPLGALFVVAALWNKGPVEQDLAARANTGLADARLNWAKVALSGRDSTLTGEAPTPEARAAAIAQAAKVFGVRNVVDASTLLPEARPFVFTATREGAKISFSGSVPSGDIRQQLAGIAKRGNGVKLTDDARNARGAPANFAAMAAFGLTELAKLANGSLTLTGSTLSLTGRAADFDAYSSIRAKLAVMPVGVTLGKGLAPGNILPPIVSPFQFDAVLSPSGVMLAGYAPSDAAREAVRKAARALGVPVTGDLRIADGAPEGGWEQAATMLVKELAQLESGKVTLRDSNAMIAGRAKGVVDGERVRADLTALPAGFALTEVTIESRVVRPFRFDAERRGETLILSGYVPNAKARTAIRELAGQFFEGEKIEDQLTEGLGEPPGFLEAALAGLRELARLGDGARMSLADRTIALKGNALLDLAREQIVKAFPLRVPSGFQARFELATAPLPPVISALPACQTLYRDLLKRKTVRFRSGSAELSETSRGILDQLAVISLRCVNARLEIGGHTDNDGTPQSNAELSRRRAETVGAYLVLAGVPVTRLEPVGYGETVPLAPNTSAENKAKNRRIEFFVK